MPGGMRFPGHPPASGLAPERSNKRREGFEKGARTLQYPRRKPGLKISESILTALGVVIVLGVFCRGAFSTGQGNLSRRFTYDKEPFKVVLFVCSLRSDQMLNSMTVYGNGRVELRTEGDQDLSEHYELLLNHEETEALLRLAVNHGLAEYDSDRIREQQRSNRGPIPQTDGPGVTTVLLSLASYENFPLHFQEVEKIIRLVTPELTSEPITGIPEIRGVAELRRRMIEMFARAKLKNVKPPVEANYGTSSFTFSSDPAEVVLSIASETGLRRRRTSMSIYGDGRTELRVAAGEQVREQYEVSLDYSEVEALLRLAVNHGLVEYDSTNIMARRFRRLQGRPYGGAADASQLKLSLSLESYTRGDYAQRNVEKSIRFYAAGLAARAFPEIKEIQGLAELQRRFFTMLAEAKKKQGDTR